MEFRRQFTLPPFRMTEAAYQSLYWWDVMSNLQSEATRRKNGNQPLDTVSRHKDFDDDSYFIRWTKDGVAEVYLPEEK